MYRHEKRDQFISQHVTFLRTYQCISHVALHELLIQKKKGQGLSNLFRDDEKMKNVYIVGVVLTHDPVHCEDIQ